MKKARTLRELFSFQGFIAKSQLEGQFGDSKSRIVVLERRKKRRSALNVVLVLEIITIEKLVALVIAMRKAIVFICAMKDGVLIANDVMVCAWSA